MKTYSQEEVIALITKFAKDAQKAMLSGQYSLPTQSVAHWVQWNIIQPYTNTTNPINIQNLTNETDNFKVIKVG